MARISRTNLPNIAIKAKVDRVAISMPENIASLLTQYGLYFQRAKDAVEPPTTSDVVVGILKHHFDLDAGFQAFLSAENESTPATKRVKKAPVTVAP